MFAYAGPGCIFSHCPLPYDRQSVSQLWTSDLLLSIFRLTIKTTNSRKIRKAGETEESEERHFLTDESLQQQPNLFEPVKTYLSSKIVHDRDVTPYFIRKSQSNGRKSQHINMTRDRTDQHDTRVGRR